MPRIAALLRYAPWMNSPRWDLSFNAMDISATREMLTSVTTKQNATNFPFHASAKSCFARSPNRSTGRVALNTNWFRPLIIFSFKSPVFLKNTPSTIIKKMGIVAFRLNIRFSIDFYLCFFIYYKFPQFFFSVTTVICWALLYTHKSDFVNWRILYFLWNKKPAKMDWFYTE